MATFEMDPNAVQKVQEMVVQNLAPKFQAAMNEVECPDHHEHPSVTSDGASWRVHGCCETCVGLGQQAISKVLE